jgi:hypothetical protein
MLLRGACHCGEVQVSFETAQPLDKIQLRACQCSFCRRHGAKTVTDPHGSLTISAPARGLKRYQFGLRITDYLLCENCGVYVAAVMQDGARSLATLNAAGMRIEGLWDREAEPAHLDKESADERVARRQKCWTPAHVVTELAQGSRSHAR